MNITCPHCNKDFTHLDIDILRFEIEDAIEARWKLNKGDFNVLFVTQEELQALQADSTGLEFGYSDHEDAYYLRGMRVLVVDQVHARLACISHGIDV